MIKNEIKEKGLNCDLNHIDVSKITDMSGLFAYSRFIGDISKWKINSSCRTINIFYECRIRDEYKPKKIIK